MPEHGSGCHTHAHRPSSVTVTQSPTNDFEASIAWADDDNNAGCTTHFDYVLYYLGPLGLGRPNGIVTVISMTRTFSTLPVDDVDLSATGNGVYRAFVRVVRVVGDEELGEQEERTSGWAYTNYLLFEDYTVEPPLAPRVRWNTRVDNADWQCTRALGCTTSINLTIVQQPGDTRNYSIEKYAATHRRGNEASLSYSHDTRDTTDDIAVTSHTRSRASARWAIHDSDGNDLWSQWSIGTSITPVPSQSALNSRSGGTRRFPLAQKPLNFTAAYNADEGSIYDITFDKVKNIAATDESWSGGLPVERYQWATSQGSSTGCYSARWRSINTSPHPTDSDKLTARIAVPSHRYLAIRAVTIAGNGTCAISATTGNPVSPPTLTVKGHTVGGQHTWICVSLIGCTANYRIVPNDPANESPSTGYKVNITSSRDFNEEPDAEFHDDYYISQRVRSETITVRLQRRVGDTWSDWSPPFNYTTSMTPEQISRDAHPALAPPNIAADYDEDSDRYTLSFDTLFPSIVGRDPIAWSGGLPIIHYEYGKVEANDQLRNLNNCPTGGGTDSDGEPIEHAQLGFANPVGEATRVSVTSYMGYAHKVWARGVTRWGRGNCAVVTPTNNPTSPDEAPIPSAPKQPTNLTYTISGSNVVLDWDAPDDDSVTGYTILRRKPVTQRHLLIYVRDTGNTDTTYTDTDAPAGEYYVYRVKALNIQGIPSPWSNYVDVDRR